MKAPARSKKVVGLFNDSISDPMGMLRLVLLKSDLEDGVDKLAILGQQVSSALE
jgi:hypothetical protein